MQEDAGPLLAPAVGEQDQEVEGPEEFRGGSLFSHMLVSSKIS